MLSVGNNTKLGKRVASISRPVGPTCPADCPFLTGIMPDGSEIPLAEKCYADSIQRRYPSVRQAWEKITMADRVSRRRALGDAIEAARNPARKRPIVAVRIHVGGDFLRDGVLDRDYVSDLLHVVAAVRDRERAEAGSRSLGFWFYTHAWRELAAHVPAFRGLGVQCFASVHTEDEAIEAYPLGYRLAIDPGAALTEHTGTWTDWNGIRALTCPEQRLGPDRVTCETCGFCFREYNTDRHVAFYRH